MIAGELYCSNIWPVNFDLKTLNGTNGFTITGLGNYGLSGPIPIGDISEDGTSDFAVIGEEKSTLFLELKKKVKIGHCEFHIITSISLGMISIPISII